MRRGAFSELVGWTALALSCIHLAQPLAARAELNFSALGALSFGGSPTLLAGGEITYGLSDIFQVGGFFHQNTLSDGSGNTGALLFYGAVARASIPASSLFFDANLGYTRSTSITGSGAALGGGLGIGMHNSFTPFLDIGPRLGVRVLPLETGGMTTSRTLVDASVLLTLRI